MFFKKKLAAFYRKVLCEKGENVKFLARDMEKFISQKQAEVADYRDYLNSEYNRLVRKRIEEYGNAKELYGKLCGIMLAYSESYFEFRLLMKQKQEVFLNQRVCSTRLGIISSCWKNYSAAIDECNELLKLLEEAVDDKPYNYLILYHNQELMQVSEEDLQEKSGGGRYMQLQQILLESSGDKAAKSAWHYAKTVEAELNLYKKEIEQIYSIKRQTYGKIEDCRNGKEQLQKMGNVLKQRMEELKLRQQGLQERQQTLYKEAKKVWEDYLGKSDVCVEYDRQIYDNDRQIELLHEEIERKRQKISEKYLELDRIKNVQNSIREKRENLKELNKSDRRMHKGYIDEIKNIKERKNNYYSILSEARNRKSELCTEHKNISQIVKQIKNSHRNDPWFNDRISRLKILSRYIDNASDEISTYGRYISACNSEIENIQGRLDWYGANLDRRNQEIENYKKDLDSLAGDYNEVMQDIRLVRGEIDILERKKKPYFEGNRLLRKKKQEYIHSRYDEFKELVSTSKGLLEV